MKRREKPSERVYTSADLPPHLAVFDPLDWGTVPSAWRADTRAAQARWHQERSAWLREHGVNPLEELRERVARRRAEMAEEWRHHPGNPHRDGGTWSEAGELRH